MLLPNDCICRADQNKPRVKSHLKGLGNTVFGLSTVQSQNHTYNIYIYILYICYICACIYGAFVSLETEDVTLFFIEGSN